MEEGGDLAFDPDHTLRDGDRIAGAGWAVEAVHTPGHLSNHLCFAVEGAGALLTGDHVMAWSTSVILPPDGDMAAYMASLEKLLARDDRIYWPAHGAPVTDPHPFVRAFIAHRRNREVQIDACLRDGLETIPAMVTRMYEGIDPRLHPAAARSVLAHLIRMVAEGRAACDGAPALGARYSLP